MSHDTRLPEIALQISKTRDSPVEGLAMGSLVKGGHGARTRRHVVNIDV